MDINWGQIIISYLFTLYIYVVPAIIIRFVVVRSSFEHKRAFTSSIIIGIYSYIIMCIILISSTGDVPKLYLASLYGLVDYIILVMNRKLLRELLHKSDVEARKPQSQRFRVTDLSYEFMRLIESEDNEDIAFGYKRGLDLLYSAENGSFIEVLRQDMTLNDMVNSISMTASLADLDEIANHPDSDFSKSADYVVEANNYLYFSNLVANNNAMNKDTLNSYNAKYNAFLDIIEGVNR